jgi:hypothetical protein
MLQSLEKLFELDRMARMFHQEVQDDKRPALLALARLMEAAGAEYVIAGGLAAQLYVSDPRFTGDVDVVAREEDAVHITEAIADLSTEFELLGRRRHWIQASHRPSGTPIDINTSPLFKQVLMEPDHVELEGIRLPIAAAVAVAYTKLRTQQPRWPRQPSKRLIDRADLIQLLQDNPGLYERLRAVAESRMHGLLDEVYVESQVTVDAYPDFDETDQAEEDG